MAQSPTKHNGSDTTHQAGTEGSGTTAPKDPRRATAPPPNPHPPADIAQQLRDFATQISAIATTEAQRDIIAKRLRNEEESKAKADQREFQFPSVLSRHRSAMATSAGDKAQTEQKLEEHRNRRESLIQNLATSLGTANEPPSQVRMREDIDVIRNQASRAGLAAQQLKEDLAKTMAQMESNNNTTHRELNSFNTRLGFAKESIDNLAATQSTPCKHEESIRSLEETLKANQETTSRRFEELSPTVSTPKNLTEEGLAEPHSGWEDKMAALSNEQKSAKSALQTDFQNLSDQFQTHRRTQETRDNTISDELETTQSSVQHLVAKVETLSQSLSGTQRHIGDILQRPSSNAAQDDVVTTASTQMPAPAVHQQQRSNVDAGFESMRSNIAKQEQSVDALNVAVHSLQSRYNNMTSEPIVRQMVGQMQTMYPYASSAQKDIERFDGELKETTALVGALDSRLEAAEKSQTQAKTERDAFLKDMNSEKDRLLQHIETQNAKIKSVEKAFDDLEKEQDHATVQQLTSIEEKLKSLKEDMQHVENHTSDQVADVLWKVEQFESQKAKVESMEEKMTNLDSIEKTTDDIYRTINNFSKRAMHEQEAERNGAGQREGQTRGGTENGHNSSGESPPGASEQSLQKKSPKKPQNVPSGPKSLSSKTTSPANSAMKMGQHATTSPTTKPHKKRKKNSSLHHRVSQ